MKKPNSNLGFQYIDSRITAYHLSIDTDDQTSKEEDWDKEFEEYLDKTKNEKTTSINNQKLEKSSKPV